MLQNLVKVAVSNYYNNQLGGSYNTNIMNNSVNFFVELISIILILLLIAFFGKYLWNEYLVKYVTICKPINNSFDLIALVILFNILFNN